MCQQTNWTTIRWWGVFAGLLIVGCGEQAANVCQQAKGKVTACLDKQSIAEDAEEIMACEKDMAEFSTRLLKLNCAQIQSLDNGTAQGKRLDPITGSLLLEGSKVGPMAAGALGLGSAAGATGATEGIQPLFGESEGTPTYGTSLAISKEPAGSFAASPLGSLEINRAITISPITNSEYEYHDYSLNSPLPQFKKQCRNNERPPFMDCRNSGDGLGCYYKEGNDISDCQCRLVEVNDFVLMVRTARNPLRWKCAKRNPAK